jgi:hypothetical protein
MEATRVRRQCVGVTGHTVLAANWDEVALGVVATAFLFLLFYSTSASASVGFLSHQSEQGKASYRGLGRCDFASALASVPNFRCGALHHDFCRQPHPPKTLSVAIDSYGVELAVSRKWVPIPFRPKLGASTPAWWWGGGNGRKVWRQTWGDKKYTQLCGRVY